MTFTAATLAEETAPSTETPVSTTLSPELERLFGGELPGTIDDLRAMEQHQRWLAEKVTPSTVGVRVGAAQGSGVIISADGYVLTAAHVAGRPGRPVQFVLHDGRIATGVTLGLNRRMDAGMMRITSEEIGGEKIETWPHAEMGDSSSLKEGQWCMATGHPGGYQRDREPVVRFGRVLLVQDSVIRSDCKLVGGDSGGPLFDVYGNVIAIHSRIGGRLTDNLHVPVDSYRDDWDRLAAGEEWGRFPGMQRQRGPYLGVTGDPEGDEARVVSVAADTPAAKAGIQPDDLIVRFNDQDVPDFRALQALVGMTRPGQKVTVELIRDGETIELEVEIGRSGGGER